MTSHATVGVDDNFTTCQTSITHRATLDEAACRGEEDCCGFVEQMCMQGRVGDMGGDDATGAVVEAIVGVDVTYLLDCFTYHRGHVDPGRGGDFTGNEYEASCGGGFACDAGCGVLYDDCVENGV